MFPPGPVSAPGITDLAFRAPLGACPPPLLSICTLLFPACSLCHSVGEGPVPSCVCCPGRLSTLRHSPISWALLTSPVTFTRALPLNPSRTHSLYPWLICSSAPWLPSLPVCPWVGISCPGVVSGTQNHLAHMQTPQTPAASVDIVLVVQKHF